jgi:hypothetical protein
MHQKLSANLTALSQFWLKILNLPTNILFCISMNIQVLLGSISCSGVLWLLRALPDPTSLSDKVSSDLTDGSQGEVMENLRSAPPSWLTAVTNFSCSSGVQRNRVLTAAAAVAVAEDGPGLSGCCPPAGPVQKGQAEQRILQNTHPSMQHIIQLCSENPHMTKPHVELENHNAHMLTK